MTFRPTVLAVNPGRELRWRGQLLLPGIFAGEHSFLIEPTMPTKSFSDKASDSAGCSFRLSERALIGTEERI